MSLSVNEIGERAARRSLTAKQVYEEMKYHINKNEIAESNARELVFNVLRKSINLSVIEFGGNSKMMLKHFVELIDGAEKSINKEFNKK